MRHFLFDFDGTITRTELLPEIGRACRIEREMTELTRQAIAGIVPFKQSFERRVELLRSVPISDVQAIVDGLPLYEELVSFIQEHSDRCHIVTGNLDAWVGATCQRICPSLICSRAIANGDQLVGVSEILDKATVVSRLNSEVVAVGEGHADAGMLDAAQVGIAFGGTHQPARSVIEVCSHLIYEEKRLCRFLRQLL